MGPDAEEIQGRLKVARGPWAIAQVVEGGVVVPAVLRKGSRKRVVVRTDADLAVVVGWLNALEAEVLGELPPPRSTIPVYTKAR